MSCLFYSSIYRLAYGILNLLDSMVSYSQVSSMAWS